MLTPAEKIIFAILTFISLLAFILSFRRIIRVIGAGQDKPDWNLAIQRLAKVLAQIITFQPVFRFRFWSSLFHALVGWGFGFYILVNLFEVTKAYFPGFEIPGKIGDIYRLLADLLTVAVLIGMIFLVLRRFAFQPANLSTRDMTLLHPKARTGILRDSAIVAGFILLHIGARMVGESFRLAYDSQMGHIDTWQPFALALSRLWLKWTASSLVAGEHISFWLSLGSILAFLPYFPYSKHIHLLFAPLNFLLKPGRKSMGEMAYINIDDQSVEQFGASTLKDLGWEQLMDSFACIMCFRCQEVCPAYETGKILSPAALEINKRYSLNSTGAILPDNRLTDFAIPPEAVWACTACGACVDICPVNNEPMRDILAIRRGLTMMENAFPRQLETAFRGMERTANPWGVPASERMKWAEGLSVPTIKHNPAPDVLWWVGCAPATDPRAQKTARAFAGLLNVAGVNFAVLGQSERCTGDAARRAGREDIFFGLAHSNVEILNKIMPKRIVTTCPHCLHTLKNEYPAFGGNYEVIHHSQLISELLLMGKLKLSVTNKQVSAAFHDPCFLGRQNGIISDPRMVLQQAQLQMIELSRHGRKSFCCGGGGAQIWKEEEHGAERISANRINEALSSGINTLVVGCPFCQIVLSDASKDIKTPVQVVDLAEIIEVATK